MLSFTLQKRGYETFASCNGKATWERIQWEKPDLLILDLMLPELDGWEICRMVRRNEKKEIREIGVLMLSARAQVEDRIQGLELGADDYLTKPFSLQELEIRVEKILKKRQAINGLYEEVDQIRRQMQEQEVGLRKIIHDLKTPLIAMGASAKLMMRRSGEEKDLYFLRSICQVP